MLKVKLTCSQCTATLSCTCGRAATPVGVQFPQLGRIHPRRPPRTFQTFFSRQAHAAGSTAFYKSPSCQWPVADNRRPAAVWATPNTSLTRLKRETTSDRVRLALSGIIWRYLTLSGVIWRHVTPEISPDLKGCEQSTVTKGCERHTRQPHKRQSHDSNSNSNSNSNCCDAQPNLRTHALRCS